MEIWTTMCPRHIIASDSESLTSVRPALFKYLFFSCCRNQIGLYANVICSFMSRIIWWNHFRRLAGHRTEIDCGNAWEEWAILWRCKVIFMRLGWPNSTSHGSIRHLVENMVTFTVVVFTTSQSIELILIYEMSCLAGGDLQTWTDNKLWSKMANSIFTRVMFFGEERTSSLEFYIMPFGALLQLRNWNDLHISNVLFSCGFG